jgi:hypothetical protein
VNHVPEMIIITIAIRQWPSSQDGKIRRPHMGHTLWLCLLGVFLRLAAVSATFVRPDLTTKLSVSFGTKDGSNVPDPVSVINGTRAPFCKGFLPSSSSVDIVSIEDTNLCAGTSIPTDVYGLLVHRGGCSFENKIKNAYFAGLHALVVVNHESEGDSFPMLTDNYYDIFVVMISYHDYQRIPLRYYPDSHFGISSPRENFLMNVCLETVRYVSKHSLTSNLAVREALRSCLGHVESSEVLQICDSEHITTSTINFLIESHLNAVDMFLHECLHLENEWVIQSLFNILQCSHGLAGSLRFRSLERYLTLLLASVKQFTLMSRVDLVSAFFKRFSVPTDVSTVSLPFQFSDSQMTPPMMSILCLWHHFTKFAFSPAGTRKTSNKEAFRSSFCLVNRSVPVRLSMFIVDENSFLQLPLDELRQLTMMFDESTVLQYIRLPLPTVNDNSSSCSDYVDSEMSQFLNGLGASDRAKLVTSLINVHYKLEVYWDETGCFECSKSHGMKASNLLRWQLCTSTLFDIAGPLSVNCADQTSKAPISSDDLLNSILPCAMLRNVFAVPAIYRDSRQYVSYITGQAAQATELNALLRKSSANNMNNTCLSQLQTRLSVIQYIYSQTPASMMIGYEHVNTADTNHRDTSDSSHTETLLAMSHYAHCRCFGCCHGGPDAEADTFDTRRLEALTTRVSVAFIGSFFFEHSVGRLLNHVIASLDKELFHVIVVAVHAYRPGYSYETADDTVLSLSSKAESWLSLPIDLRKTVLADICADNITADNPAFSLKCAAERIAALRADVVVYPELGMDIFTSVLAQHQRYAPVQCVFWGHPISQQIYNVDYFISSAFFEYRVSQRRDHPYQRRYEQTVMFDSLSTYFKKYEPPFIQRKLPVIIENSMAAQGLMSTSHNASSSLNRFRVYFLPHTVMKYSIEFSEVLAMLLLQDKDALLVLVYSELQKIWKHYLLRRLSEQLVRLIPTRSQSARLRTVSNCLDRVLVIPRLDSGDYRAFITGHVDAVLDPFPFGALNLLRYM